jgi:hypothetical protein
MSTEFSHEIFEPLYESYLIPTASLTSATLLKNIKEGVIARANQEKTPTDYNPSPKTLDGAKTAA